MLSFADLQFRQYERADHEAVVQLHQEGLRSSGAVVTRGAWDSDIDDIEGQYLNNGGDFLLGFSNRALIAMGAYRKVDATTAELKRMRVRPDCQGNGIGTALLLYLEGEIRSRGYQSIDLDTTDTLKVAMHMYPRHGYHLVRTEKRPELSFTLYYYHKELTTDAS